MKKTILGVVLLIIGTMILFGYNYFIWKMVKTGVIEGYGISWWPAIIAAYGLAVLLWSKT